jgi:UDP-glucuronate 4-epimerase
MSKPTILVTGAAGFIGMHLSRQLLQMGYAVHGVDELNAYYDVAIKESRLGQLKELDGFSFTKLDLADHGLLRDLFARIRPKYVVHLAAQAGVRYSLINPFAYNRSNLLGMTAILECVREFPVEHFLYASSSSVYGGNKTVPFRETDRVDDPVSFYAATKRANELMANVYARSFGIPSTALRFFTVYGPWGRPDMAYWSFTEKVLRDQPIEVYGQGLLSRDFTYCDDVVTSIGKLIALPPADAFDARILNVGNSSPNTVNQLIEAVENATGKKARRVDKEQPLGDVEKTFADSSALEALTGFKPATALDVGIDYFVSWYRTYFKV